MVSGRRHADDLDDLSSFLGSPPVDPHTEAEELDELGRVVPRSNPTAARRDRQYARATRRSRRRGSGRRFPTESEDGYSTDASLPPSEPFPSIPTRSSHAPWASSPARQTE